MRSLSDSEEPVRPETAHRTASATRRVAANLAYIGLGYLLSLLSQFATVPLFLRAWGSALYGDWITITAIAAYFGLADMGMQTYVVNELTRQWVQRRREDFERTFQSALMVYATLLAVGVTTLVLFVIALPWGQWFAGRAFDGKEASALLVLGGLSVLTGVAVGFLAGIHRALARPERSSLIGLIIRASGLLTVCACLVASASPLVLGSAQVIVLLVIGVFVAWTVRAPYEETRFSFRQACRSTALALVWPSLLFLFISLAHGLAIQGTILVASAFLGAHAVTTLTTARTLAAAVRQLVAVLYNGLWPELTRLQAEGAIERLRLVHRLLIKLSCATSVWLSVSLYHVGPILHAAWTGGRAGFDPNLFNLLLLYGLLQTPWLACSVLLSATNRHQGLAVLHAIQGVLAVLACIAAVYWVGLSGIGLALLVTDFLTFGLLVPAWTQTLLGEPRWRFYLDFYLPVVALGAASWFAGGLAWQLTSNPLGTVLFVTAAAGILVGISTWYWMRPAERIALATACRRLRTG